MDASLRWDDGTLWVILWQTADGKDEPEADSNS